MKFTGEWMVLEIVIMTEKTHTWKNKETKNSLPIFTGDASFKSLNTCFKRSPHKNQKSRKGPQGRFKAMGRKHE